MSVSSSSSGSSGTGSGGEAPGAGDSSLAPALARLNRAMEKLEGAVEMRLEREAHLADTEAEVQRIGADRTRLAESLDGAEARAMRLESANREVSRRLVDAMEAIRAVLDRPASAES